MKDESNPLLSVWNKYGFAANRKVLLEKYKLDEVVASIFSNGPFYFYIVDLYDRNIELMSPLVKSIHGTEPERTTFMDILSFVHPDDMEFVAKAEGVAGNLLYQQLHDKLDKYKVSYCFRMKTADGSYALFNHQSLTLTTDDNGKISKSLNIHTNISHLTSQNNFRVSAIGLHGEPSFLNIPVDYNVSLLNPSASLFTKREVQIIRLMSEGLTNERIAEQLHIASNTVKNHRKSILQKANCKNMAQLVTKCITEGLI